MASADVFPNEHHSGVEKSKIIRMKLTMTSTCLSVVQFSFFAHII
jgi:hypothetical protein